MDKGSVVDLPQTEDIKKIAVGLGWDASAGVNIYIYIYILAVRGIYFLLFIEKWAPSPPFWAWTHPKRFIIVCS